MAYKPFTLEVEGKTISLHSGRDSLTRTFGDENTAAQRFGETLALLGCVFEDLSDFGKKVA